MTKLDQYQAIYKEVLLSKPVDAAIEGQSVRITSEGIVSINFSSDLPDQIKALRDWLTILLEE